MLYGILLPLSLDPGQRPSPDFYCSPFLPLASTLCCPGACVPYGAPVHALTVMTFPQYNQREKWTRILTEKQNKSECKGSSVYFKGFDGGRFDHIDNRGRVDQSFRKRPKGDWSAAPSFKLPCHPIRWPFGIQRKAHNTKRTYNLHRSIHRCCIWNGFIGKKPYNSSTLFPVH